MTTNTAEDRNSFREDDRSESPVDDNHGTTLERGLGPTGVTGPTIRREDSDETNSSVEDRLPNGERLRDPRIKPISIKWIIFRVLIGLCSLLFFVCFGKILLKESVLVDPVIMKAVGYTIIFSLLAGKSLCELFDAPKWMNKAVSIISPELLVAIGLLFSCGVNLVWGHHLPGENISLFIYGVVVPFVIYVIHCVTWQKIHGYLKSLICNIEHPVVRVIRRYQVRKYAMVGACIGVAISIIMLFFIFNYAPKYMFLDYLIQIFLLLGYGITKTLYDYSLQSVERKIENKRTLGNIKYALGIGLFVILMALSFYLKSAENIILQKEVAQVTFAAAALVTIAGLTFRCYEVELKKRSIKQMDDAQNYRDTIYRYGNVADLYCERMFCLFIYVVAIGSTIMTMFNIRSFLMDDVLSTSPKVVHSALSILPL
ncbi:hypothetical protein NEOKW01_0419 [Nematocida sp. AWRm80]|nr:hypothetical protein NEOKW01_0419 [Nematocida sp. AWRm80]